MQVVIITPIPGRYFLATAGGISLKPVEIMTRVLTPTRTECWIKRAHYYVPDPHADQMTTLLLLHIYAKSDPIGVER